MLNKEVKKIYQELIFENIEDKGFNFLKSTFQEKFGRKLLPNKVPINWKKIYFKTYPRLPQIPLILKNTKKRDNHFFSLIRKRKSEREFRGCSLELNDISQILYFSAGIQNLNKFKKEFDKSRRMYPSAGARYPLELYPVIFKSGDLPMGIYHYNVKWNTLELLLKGNFKKEFSKKITDQEWVKRSSMIIVITAVYSRTLIKYNERGWRFIFFEVGHLGQNLYLISQSLKLKCCAIGGFIDEEIISLLDLRPKSELPLYLIVIGK